jgi:Immunity protein 53
VTGDALARLQRWYSAQCDGDWEHEYGVKRDTLDNPGWAVEIDLAGTGTDPSAFPAVKDHRTEDDWIICRVEDETFLAFGGPQNLDELLAYFLDRVSG